MTRRKTPGAYLRIEIGDLQRRGWLNPLKGGQYAWSRDGRPFFTLAAVMLENGSDLLLKHDRGETIIPIARTRQHLGGTRPWFVCPYCDRRAGILYGGPPFTCRSCGPIAYPSQRRSPGARQMDKCFALRRAAGASSDPGEDCLLDPFPERPFRMHRSTYWRLEARYQTAIREHWNRSAAALARYEKHLG